MHEFIILFILLVIGHCKYLFNPGLKEWEKLRSEQGQIYENRAEHYKQTAKISLTQERKNIIKKIRKTNWEKLRNIYGDKNIKNILEELKKNIEILNFSSKELLLLGFYMIIKHDYQGYAVVKGIEKILKIDLYRSWQKLIKLFITCGPTYQKKFLNFFSKNAFNDFYRDSDWIYACGQHFFITYDVIKRIKNTIDFLKKNNQLVELYDLKSFLSLYLLKSSTNLKNNRFCCFGLWDYSEFYSQLIQQPLYKIGEQGDKKIASDLENEFLHVMTWLDKILEKPKNKTIKNMICSDLFKFAGHKDNKEKSFQQKSYALIPWAIMNNINPNNDPRTENSFREDSIDESDMNLLNFSTVLEVIDTKTYNEFFVAHMLHELPHYHTQYFDFLYYTAQKVCFTKEEQWEIIEKEENNIEIKSNFFSRNKHIREIRKQYLTSYLSGAQINFINQKWQQFLNHLDQDDIVKKLRIPSIKYKEKQLSSNIPDVLKKN